MRAQQISITLKPNLLEWVKMNAMKRQLSFSGYMTRLVENDMESKMKSVVTDEDLDQWSQDLVKDPATNKPKVWSDVDSFMKDLQDEARALHEIR